MEKNIEISMLFELYGNMLTDKQKQIIDDYYNHDLSLSEIGENVGITRQAVRDNLKNAEKNLYDLENKLGFLKKQKELNQKLEDILKELNKSENIDKEKIKKQIQNIINNL